MTESAKSQQRPSILGYAAKDLSRFGQISKVLFRHGFGTMARQKGLKVESGDDDVSPEKNPRDTAIRFRRTLEELGPTFVKLGQVLSTRPDLLPPVFIEELSKLQDNSPPLDFETIRTLVEETLETTIEEAFDSFDEKPLATGSIAQTHLATLHDQRSVVIKVQRPNLGEIIRSDIDLLKILSWVLEATIEEMGLYTPSAIIDEFDVALRQELDFRIENIMRRDTFVIEGNLHFL